MMYNRQSDLEVSQQDNWKTNLDRIFRYAYSLDTKIEVFLGAQIQTVYRRGNNSRRANIHERYFVVDFMGVRLMSYESVNFLYSIVLIYNKRNIGFESIYSPFDEVDGRWIIEGKKIRNDSEDVPNWPIQQFAVSRKNFKKEIFFMDAVRIFQFEKALSKALSWYAPPTVYDGNWVDSDSYESAIAKYRSKGRV